MNFTTKGTAILGALLFASSAVAQTMSVTPGNLLRLNQPATITYTDRDKAGQTVRVLVTGGLPISVVEITMVLDEKGRGTAVWTPTNGLWLVAVFSAPGVVDISLPVV